LPYTTLFRSVVIADYAKEAAENIAAEIRKDNREAIAIQVDVGSKQSVTDMVKATLDKYGRIDFLLNGAGVLTRVSVVEMPEEDWDRVLRINMKGTVLCSQAVAEHMSPKKHGGIIIIASDGEVEGHMDAANHGAHPIAV